MDELEEYKELYYKEIEYTEYNGSVVKTKILYFYNELIY